MKKNDWSFFGVRGDIRIRGRDEEYPSDDEYTLMLFVASYESRATSVARLVRDAAGRTGACLLYREHCESDVRRETQQEIVEIVGARTIDIGDRGFERMYEIVSDHILQTERPRILIDYSCMTKDLYLAALLAVVSNPCDAVFVYDVGTREASDWEDISGTEVISVETVPGLEGRTSGDASHLFSFGFDGHLAAALEETLQPRRLYGLVADPGAEAEDNGRASSMNKRTIDHCEWVFRHDIRDVLGIVGEARALASGDGRQSGLVCVPMGPKSHCFALALLAAVERQVTFLKVAKGRSPNRNVAAANRFSVTRLSSRLARGR